MTDINILMFSLFYILVCFCFVFKTKEFVLSGISVENIFSSYLGTETENFVLFHIRLTSITFVVHSILPLGYLISVFCFFDENQFLFSVNSIIGYVFVILSSVIPAISIYVIYLKFKNNFEKHPIVIQLKAFCDSNNNWKNLASDINNEIKRVDKIVLQYGVTRVIVTDNWIIKQSLYNLNIAHKNHSVLILCNADTHNFSSTGTGVVQYLNIEVKPTRNGAKNFVIRCNALDYKDLEEKINRPIVVLQNVTFHKSRIEIFLEVFRNVVEKNHTYEPLEIPEMCIGCMVAQSNVKLVKNCSEPNESDVNMCATCNCRPMWCVDCMGRWWASRQSQDLPETWLSSKCSCPVCRSIFCILDVCLVQL